MRVPGGLNIRSRILLIQLCIGTAFIAMVAVGFLALQKFNHHLARGELAHRQLGALTSLARNADRYSERVADLLATGRPDAAAIADLRNEVALGLNRVERSIRAEQEFLVGHRNADAAMSELERMARLQQLYNDMNLTIEALLVMRQAGQGNVAARIFYRELESGLGDKFESVIAGAIADEMEEIAQADTDAGKVARRLGWFLGGTMALVLCGVLVAGYFLYRSIVKPVARLGAGTLAIGQGDLSTRVGPLGNDELGLLARRFDGMAEQLERQNEQLIAARSDLERQVRARTAELLHANAQLRGIDRSRLNFLADISHELRTPLTIMRGEAEVTLRAKTADLATYRETLDSILGQTREMGRLVEDLMTLARCEIDEIRIEMEQLDLRDVAGEAAQEARILGRARGIQISTELNGPAPVNGDCQRIKQILMIVLDNAVKYSEPGRPVTLMTATDDTHATATVRNRCGHMAEKELQHLFDRFYRGRGAAVREQVGSGLGLGIAQRLAEKQAGSILLAQEADDGLTVAVRFPLARNDQVSDPDAEEVNCEQGASG